MPSPKNPERRKQWIENLRQCQIRAMLKNPEKYLAKQKKHAILGAKASARFYKLHPDFNRNLHNRLKKEDPEKYFRVRSIGGKTGGKIRQEKYPGLTSEVFKKWCKDHPEELSIRNTLNSKPKNASKIMIRTNKKYPNLSKRAGQASVKANRDKKPYIWQDVHFDSKQEMELAKILLSKPIEGVNCHIKIGHKIIDFYPQKSDILFKGSFIEFHPWDMYRTPEQYYQERLDTINNSHLKGIPLVLITSMENDKEVS